MNTKRCQSGAGTALGLLHLVGSFRAVGRAAEQYTIEFFDSSKKKWIRKNETQLSNNGGCTVQVSPTDVVVISGHLNPGNLPFAYRTNLVRKGFKHLARPPLAVRINFRNIL